MNANDGKGQLEPVNLGPQSRFNFRCHRGLSCFTQCCRGIEIILTPYDIIRLKNRLDLTSETFLAIYTKPRLLEKTELPVVTLKRMDDDDSSCPFVREQGCFVYDDRPATCRYYPLGLATLTKTAESDEEFYFFVNEPHCRGFEEEKAWTVRDWREDQGVDRYDRANALWIDLIVRKRSFPPGMKLTEQTKKMFFLASYNIDEFRKFVFESSFLDRYEVDDETIKRLRDDEAGLLEFGMTWLLWLLYRKGDFAMKETGRDT